MTVKGTTTDVRTIVIAAALTSGVVSLTLVAVYLATGQFSPRIVGALLNDRRSQSAVGLGRAHSLHDGRAARSVNFLPDSVATPQANCVSSCRCSTGTTT